MKSLLILLILLLAVPYAHAAGQENTPHLIGTSGYWRAYTVADHGQPVCYMTLTAHFPRHAKFHRGDALLTITQRPGENSTDVISYSAGYNFKPMSSTEMQIGASRFSLFTSQDTAWSRDAATDHKIAAAIRRASALTITGSPSKGSMAKITDNFSLKGANEAYHTIGKACGMEVKEEPAQHQKPKSKKPHPLHIR